MRTDGECMGVYSIHTACAKGGTELKRPECLAACLHIRILCRLVCVWVDFFSDSARLAQCIFLYT